MKCKSCKSDIVCRNCGEEVDNVCQNCGGDIEEKMEIYQGKEARAYKNGMNAVITRLKKIKKGQVVILLSKIPKEFKRIK